MFLYSRASSYCFLLTRLLRNRRSLYCNCCFEFISEMKAKAFSPLFLFSLSPHLSFTTLSSPLYALSIYQGAISSVISAVVKCTPAFSRDCHASLTVPQNFGCQSINYSQRGFAVRDTCSGGWWCQFDAQWVTLWRCLMKCLYLWKYCTWSSSKITHATTHRALSDSSWTVCVQRHVHA
jgi:hypothetical protein